MVEAMTTFRTHAFPRDRQDNSVFDIWDHCPQCGAMFNALKIANHGPASDSSAFRMKAMMDHMTAAVAQDKETSAISPPVRSSGLIGWESVSTEDHIKRTLWHLTRKPN